MAEQMFFDRAGVRVSTARFIAGDRTYAISAVTSVRFNRIVPKRGLPIILFCVGGFLLLGAIESGSGGAGVFVALLFGGLGAALWYSTPSRYSVRVMTASGEADAFVSKDRQLVFDIVQALNDAIVARG